MLSRVADSLYWIGQNMERADSMAKLLSVRLVSVLENHNPALGTEHDWEEVIESIGNKVEFSHKYHSFDREAVIDYVAFSKENSNSIYSCIKTARENAKMIREVIPIPLWEVINELYLEIGSLHSTQIQTVRLNAFFQSIHEKYFLFQGIVSGLMPREEGYFFLLFGKYIEIIRRLARALDVYYHKKVETKENIEDGHYHYWSAVLNSLSGYEFYIQKHHARMDPVKIVNYLLFDDSLPRSAKYSVQQLVHAFHTLEKQTINEYARNLSDVLKNLSQIIAYGTLEELPLSLHDYFVQLQDLCDKVGIAIMETYYLGEISPT